MTLMGVDAAEIPQIAGAIMDWIDRDDDTQMGSSDTESDYYMGLEPPYRAKNGPIDDLSELMLIRGITPEMYWGSGGAGVRSWSRGAQGLRSQLDEPSYPIGFVDLFTSIGGKMNINTASATQLQVFPEVDEMLAQEIVKMRAGPDGMEGNEDDMPFPSVQALGQVRGMHPAAMQRLSQYCGVRSMVFQVEVTCQIDRQKRTYVAILYRSGQQAVVLYWYWR
jgi:general secretion pathway protein K